MSEKNLMDVLHDVEPQCASGYVRLIGYNEDVRKHSMKSFECLGHIMV